MRWAGALRAVLAGDLGSHASLEPLADLAHLYAVGPLAGLRGEITVVDGRPYVSRVEDGRIVVDPSFHHEAAFLVWAEIARWHDLDIPDTMLDDRGLEDFVVERSRESGMAIEMPFAFVVTGMAARVSLHILDRRYDRPHSRERHEEIKVPFAIERCAVEVVGFCSQRHAGIFVPAGRRTHMHVCSRDGAVAGHVDDLRLGPGMTLRLPAAS